MPPHRTPRRLSAAASDPNTGRALSSLIEPGRQRLRIMALTMALAFSCGLAINAVFARWGWQPVFRQPLLTTGSFIALVLLSVLVFHVVGRPGITAQRLLLLGRMFHLCVALGLALPAYWGADEQLTMAMTPLSVWIVLFALVVPTTPLSGLTTALSAAAIAPLMLVMGWAGASSLPDTEMLVRVTLPNVICAGLALFPLFVSYSAARRLAEADRRLREMGSYRLIERIGGGGMGEVWRAEHRLLARPAAVKLIRPDTLGQAAPQQRADIIARFEREARAVAGLKSPHSVRLFDFGSDDQGVFHCVMELLDGIDLEGLVRDHGPIGPARCCHLLRQVCLALAEAHQHGVVHRDIKPANIMICRMGVQCDVVKVLDFGLATCRCDGADPPARRLTDEDQIIGTPAYMAPELLEGHTNINGQADIYALGCVAYYLLCGQQLFTGPGIEAIITGHLHKPPPPLRSRTDKPLPADLEVIIMECLNKDPQRRPTDALSLWHRLGTCSDATSWNDDLARAWWRRHRPQIISPC